ncbi:hypothetical protein [Actinoplanes sp. NPDC049118]|uniref:hypothetical protein n=1 Tax=Actinoplanes sp. NPDC049118 TaxID=3155769 RepID=UPI0033EF0B3E
MHKIISRSRRSATALILAAACLAAGTINAPAASAAETQSCDTRKWDPFFMNKKDAGAKTSNGYSALKGVKMCLSTSSFSVEFQIEDDKTRGWHWLDLVMFIDDAGAICHYENLRKRSKAGIAFKTTRTCSWTGGPYQGEHTISWYWRGDLKDDGKGELVLPGKGSRPSTLLRV